MKKRLLCMALILIMAMSALFLASCSKDEETAQDNADEGAKTITMWVVSENKVSTEDEKLVEAAFSEITKSKFKVNVDIKYFTEDEYLEKLENAMKLAEEEKAQKELCAEMLDEAIAAAKKKGNSDKDAVRQQFFTDHPEFAKFKDDMVDIGAEDEGGNAAVEEDETVINEDYGIPEIKYPEAGENQVDIIYLAGYDTYVDFVEKEWLAALDEELAGNASKLMSYISSTLMNGVKQNNTTYAIPNNVEIGKYTYMLLDKELVDSYPLNYEKVSSVVDCKNFINDMIEYEPNVIPIASTYDECMKMLVWHWNIEYTSEVVQVLDEFGQPVIDVVYDANGEIKVDKDGNPILQEKKYTKYDYSYITDGGKFNMIGVVYSSAADISRGKMNMEFTNLLANQDYIDTLLTLKYYEYNNCYGTPAEDQKVAISFVEGSYAIKAEADLNGGVYTDENGKKYYPVIVKYPQAEENDLYGSMFAVSAFSENLAESMQVLTELNTTSVLKNILQYGVEGEHYELQTQNPEISPVKRLEGCEYIMDINKTGNCFLSYPEEGQPIDYWENVKIQNNDSLVNPLLGFDFNERLAGLSFDETAPEILDNNLIKNINGLSAEIWGRIEACQNYEELEVLFYGTPGNTSDCLVTLYGPDVEKPKYGSVTVDLPKFTNHSWQSEDGSTASGHSPYTIYKAWCDEFGYWAIETVTP